MPYGDRTGPEGKGPRTGRGLGKSIGNKEGGYNQNENRRNAESGHSHRHHWAGAQHGHGHGWRHRFEDYLD